MCCKQKRSVRFEKPTVASGGALKALGVTSAPVDFMAAKKSIKKFIKIMVWGIFRETRLGRFTDKVVQKSVPMQRGARFAFSRSAPMQRGARFAFCEMRAMHSRRDSAGLMG